MKPVYTNYNYLLTCLVLGLLEVFEEAQNEAGT